MTDPDSDPFASARSDLRDTLAGHVDDERVLDAMEAVPRHAFVPESRRTDAYRDRPLPIGDGQTVSAPHIVAIMAELLDLEPGDRVLEIGTGCGYHAAVTAELVGAQNVYSVEYSESLAETARDRLAALGYDGISIRVGDGRDGWKENVPYRAAYATCALGTAPTAVLDQLRHDGTFLAPIGTARQTLVRLARTSADEFERSEHGAVRFVSVRG
ncbi:protein-L-isoaspartate(D-aspartate) O-methyltransferase [Halovivax gelatinilyticus]|uniref:protein-L-isoaspartate(D-aspartate) O-methyltransferase n=1 Tax=Halovivax gelatinilyticus TaxID=2961597 RepID=UPI0020CA57DF|nr:protein-L-isoaspartate(D-aspartate) O-methyltransferase [Halovivax gelatinilyticus]